MEVNHSVRGHSQLGASSSERWLTCPASVKLISELKAQGKIKDTGSKYADEGSTAHELAELAITNNVEPHHYIGTVNETYGIEITQEMADHVKVYTDYIRNSLVEGAELVIEEKFHLSHIDEELYGTSDCSIGIPFGTLEVIDFKYGQGVPVEAEGNPQLLYYTLGAALGGDYMNYKTTIVQPRCPHAKGPIRSWEFGQDVLDAFAKELKAGAKATREANPKFGISEKGCKFCSAKSYCPEQKKELKAVAKSVFNDEVKSIATMTEEEVVLILEKKDQILDFIKSVESRAFAMLMSGTPVKGYKLVEGRKNRIWGDENQVISDYEDFFSPEELFTKKLKTPAQLEKLLGKEAMAKYTVTPAGEPTMAKETDKRKALVLPTMATASVVFDDKDTFEI